MSIPAYGGRPIALPGWALETNFAAGANPWNGQPCKLAPVGDLFIPGVKPAAEESNYLENLKQATVNSVLNLCTAPAVQWGPIASVQIISKPTISGLGYVSKMLCVEWDAAQDKWLVCVTDNSLVPRVFVGSGHDGIMGNVWLGFSEFLTSLNLNQAGFVTGWVSGTALPDFGLATTNAQSWSEYGTISTGNTPTFAAVVADPANLGGCCLADYDGTNLRIRKWNGTTWSIKRTTAVTSLSDLHMVVQGTTIVWAYTSSGSAFTLSSTTDGGATFHDAAFTQSVSQSCFLKTDGTILLALTDQGGNIYSSPDGVTWTTNVQNAAVIGTTNSLVCCGLTKTITKNGNQWLIVVNTLSDSINTWVSNTGTGTWAAAATLATTLVPLSDVHAIGSLVVAAWPVIGTATTPTSTLMSPDGGYTWYKGRGGLRDSLSTNKIANSGTAFIMYNQLTWRLSGEMGIPSAALT